MKLIVYFNNKVHKDMVKLNNWIQKKLIPQISNLYINRENKFIHNV